MVRAHGAQAVKRKTRLYLLGDPTPFIIELSVFTLRARISGAKADGGFLDILPEEWHREDEGQGELHINPYCVAALAESVHEEDDE